MHIWMVSKNIVLNRTHIHPADEYGICVHTVNQSRASAVTSSCPTHGNNLGVLHAALRRCFHATYIRGPYDNRKHQTLIDLQKENTGKTIVVIPE